MDVTAEAPRRDAADVAAGAHTGRVGRGGLVEWVVWIVVILGVLFWITRRDPAHGSRPPAPRTPETRGRSSADSRRAPPSTRPDRGEDQFIDGAVFGYLAAQHWPDGDGEGMDDLWSDDETEWHVPDDDPATDADIGQDTDAWDDFGDGFGDFG